MSFHCTECGVSWWPWMAKEFGGACPLCLGGTIVKQAPGSMDCETLYAEALQARKARDERQAKIVAFEEFYDAWQHEQRSNFEAEVLDELSLLPVAEPRRNLAA